MGNPEPVKIFRPHDYQAAAIQWVLDKPCLGLFLGMGMGKTSIVLTAINELQTNRWEVSKALVIAPKKVAEASWQAEAAKWEHTRHLRLSLVLGTVRQREKALAEPADIYITSRDNVCWLVDFYRNAWPFDMVVLDESSSFKNASSKRFKALKLVRSRICRLVELTGTPASNGLEDLWAQVYLLDGGQRLGKTMTAYRERFFDPDRRSRVQIFSYRPKDGAKDSIEEAIKDICFSLRAEDYLELPPMMKNIIPVKLDSAAQRQYDRMEREMLLEIDESLITASTAAVLTNKLLQLCNGAAYDENHKAVSIHQCKVEAFLETVERLNGESALVFYSFLSDLDTLIPALEPLKLRVRLYRSAEDERDWNAGKIDILLAHPASCAYGLNLQNGGYNIIWFGLTWSLEQYEQANKRLHRQGQNHPVMVHHLVVQGGRDEDVMSALEGKKETQDSLLESLKARIQKAKEQEG